MLVVALIGSVQPFKFYLKPQPSGDGQIGGQPGGPQPTGTGEGESNSPDPFYVAPLYWPSSNAASYYSQQPGYRAAEYPRFGSQYQETRAYSPLRPAYLPNQYASTYNPYPQLPLSYLVVRPGQSNYPLTASRYGYRAQGLRSSTKGGEPPRIQQEVKGLEPPRQQGEIKGAEPQRLQPAEAKGQSFLPSYHRQEQQQEQLPEQQQELEQERDTLLTPPPPPPAQPQSDQDLINHYYAMKQSKLARFKNSLHNFAAAAKAKFTLGSSYQVVSEETIQPPQPQPHPDEQQQQQEEVQEQERDVQLQVTEAPLEPERQEAVKGLPERQEPVKGLPERQEPIKTLPERQEPIKGLPERQEPVKGLPERQEPVKGLPERQEPVKGLPERQEPVKGLPERQETIKSLPQRLEPVQTPNKGFVLQSAHVSTHYAPHRTYHHSSPSVSDDSFNPVVSDLRREQVRPQSVIPNGQSQSQTQPQAQPAVPLSQPALQPPQPVQQSPPQPIRSGSSGVSSVSTN